MQSNDERDRRQQILFRFESIQQDDGANNRNNLEAYKNSVDLSVKTTALPSKRDVGRGKDDRDGDKNRCDEH